MRMAPAKCYPVNFYTRSFLTSRETVDIGRGIVLVRGVFQSVRPAMHRMLIKVDTSTTATYKPGRLIDLSLEVLPAEIASKGPLSLSPARGLPEPERIKLQSFLSGVRVNINIPGRPSTGRRPARTIKRLTTVGADQLSFTTRDGRIVTVAQYFKERYNYHLQFPDIVCVQVRSPL